MTEEVFKGTLADGSAYVEKIEAPKQRWYFTFGYGQRDPLTDTPMKNKYCLIEGGAEEARQIMLDRFGKEWSWQYKYADDVPEEDRGAFTAPYQWRGAGVKRFGLQLFDHMLTREQLFEPMSTRMMHEGNVTIELPDKNS